MSARTIQTTLKLCTARLNRLNLVFLQLKFLFQAAEAKAHTVHLCNTRHICTDVSHSDVFITFLQSLSWTAFLSLHLLRFTMIFQKIGHSLSGYWLSVGLRRRLSSAAFCHIEDVCCETNVQQLWRQVLRSGRSETVEQPSSWPARLTFNDLSGY